MNPLNSVRGSIITGDSVIEFVEPTQESLLRRFDGTMGTPRDEVLDARELAASNEFITDNSFLDGGEVAKDPFDSLTRLESTLVPVLTTVERALARIDSIGASIQEVVGQDKGPVRELVASVKATADDVQTTVKTVNRVVMQFENAQIPNGIANGLAILPDLFKEAQTTLAQTQRTLKGFEQFSASLEGLGKEFEGIGETIREAVDNANVAVKNIADITDPVSKNSEVLVNNAVRALANLDTLAVDLKRLTSRINNSNGTVAQLIDNPQLYIKATETLNNIQSASGNIQLLTQKLQPILNDVRIFTDKVARDPGQVGVRGALSARPLGVGLK